MNTYDLFQNLRIDSLRYDTDRADVKSIANRGEIAVLQDQIDHLSLVCQAMCELMEGVGFDKNMLNTKIQEIDLRDGKLDGKFKPAQACAGCSRPVSSRHVKCMYCGESLK